MTIELPAPQEILDELDSGVFAWNLERTSLVYANRAARAMFVDLGGDGGGLPALVVEQLPLRLPPSFTPGVPLTHDARTFFVRFKRAGWSKAHGLGTLAHGRLRGDELESLLASSFGLRPRQARIVALLRNGLRNRDIAAELGLTEGTVKQQLNRIFAACGVRRRTELLSRVENLSAPAQEAPRRDRNGT